MHGRAPVPPTHVEAEVQLPLSDQWTIDRLPLGVIKIPIASNVKPLVSGRKLVFITELPARHTGAALAVRTRTPKPTSRNVAAIKSS
jgi:hypothetical protein